jgi:hypothetical protein
MVIKIGKERQLSKPLNFDQEAFLFALGIKPSWLIKPQPVRRTRGLKKTRPKK